MDDDNKIITVVHTCPECKKNYVINVDDLIYSTMCSLCGIETKTRYIWQFEKEYSDIENQF